MASATVVKTIGTGGTYDFASLSAAATWWNHLEKTDNVVFEICTNLTEPTNVGIYNNSNFSLTIRPNADEDRMITFTKTADNAGPSGSFIIGGDHETNFAFAATGNGSNITIDGAAEGYTTRRLTIKGPGYGRTISFYGAMTNTSIKNCIVINNRSGSSYAIEVRPEKGTNNHPEGLLIDNCRLESTAGPSNQGIYINSSQKSSTEGFVHNTIIKNCEIIASTRGIFINEVNNLDVIGCTIKLNQPNNGMDSYGIWGYATVRGTINIQGCNFSELKTMNTTSGSYGMTGIAASEGDAETVWNIENNYFTGLDALNGAVTTCKLVAVRCGNNSKYNIRHNTFVMKSLTNHPTTTLVNANPLSMVYLAGDGQYVVKNNIFISHETVAHNSLIRGALGANCTHNVFYHDGGNAAIVAGAAVCENMNKLRASYPTQGADSKWLNVQFDANMALTGKSIDNVILSVPAIAEVATDINGAARHNPTYAGAEEASVMPTISAIYMIGGNNTWNPTIGTQLEEISAGIYQGEFTFEETKFFAFVTALEADEEAWDALNAHRLATETIDENVVNVTSNLVYGIDRSMQLPRGKFRITVNTNSMYIKVLQLFDNLYEIGDNQGEWHANVGVSMTQVSENVFEGDFSFTKPLNYFAFTSEMANDDNDGAWVWLNSTVRYAGTEDEVRLDDASEVAVGKGNYSFTILPGVYHFVVDMNLMKITVTQSVAKVSFDSEIGYATYYNSKKGYTMPANVTGYAFNYPGGLSQAFEAGQDVPAGVALVLAGPAGTFDLVLKTGVAPVDLANQLRGTDVDELTTAPTADEYLFYGLSLADPGQGLLPDPQSVGFYWMADNGEAFINKAHKAYLALMENVFDPAFLAPAILFNENNATNIENVEGQEKAVKFIENGQIYIRKDGVVYDAMGRVIR